MRFQVQVINVEVAIMLGLLERCFQCWKVRVLSIKPQQRTFSVFSINPTQGIIRDTFSGPQSLKWVLIYLLISLLVVGQCTQAYLCPLQPVLQPGKVGSGKDGALQPVVLSSQPWIRLSFPGHPRPSWHPWVHMRTEQETWEFLRTT